jgi:hypothetical protein
LGKDGEKKTTRDDMLIAVVFLLMALVVYLLSRNNVPMLGLDNVPVILLVVAGVLVACAGYAGSAKPKEGFATGSTPTDIATCVKNANSELLDELNMATYRSNYEDLITQLQTNCDLNMVKLLTTMCTKDGSTNDTAVEQFNGLSNFKAKLTETMTFLDDN